MSRELAWRPNLRCPRNGTANEARFFIEPASALAHTPLKARFREGRQGRFVSPDTGQRGGALRERRVYEVRVSGEAVAHDFVQ